MPLRDNAEYLSRKPAYHWILLALVATIAGCLTWAVLFPLEIRVVAPGEITGDKDVIEIRAIESGVVRRLAVANGATVTAGQILVELEDEDLRQQKEVTLEKIEQLECSVHNTTAELDALLTHKDAILRAIETAEEAALQPLVAYRPPCSKDHTTYRMTNLVDNLRLKLELITNRQSDIRDLDRQIELTRSQIESLEEDVRAMTVLAGKKLVSQLQMRQLERQVHQANLNLSNYANKQAAFRRTIAETRKEAKLEVSKHQRALVQEQHGDQLAITDEKLKLGNIESRFVERTVKSPIDGVVIDVNTFVMTNYAQKSELLMKIAPPSRLNHLKARVALEDIDNINRDETAMVRFATHAELRDFLIGAAIETINPIKLESQNGTESYYEVTLRITDPRYEGASKPMQSGAPAEILFAAEYTTLAEALIRPVTQNWPKIFER